MAAFGPFERYPELAIALSGGVDSLTLLKLGLDWAKSRSGRVLALIVDHDLRPNSSSEALAVAEYAAKLGASTRILRWHHAKLESRLQERARQARYELLNQACYEADILHVLLGHHADDQTETILMRAERKSRARGLAGMSSIIDHSHCRMLRPLLIWPRARIEATAKMHRLTWIDDPSNRDRRFWRGAYRQQGAAKPAIKTAVSSRQHADQDEAQLLARAISISPLGYVFWPCSGHQEQLLAPVIASIGGQPYRRHLKSRFDDQQALTVGGCILCGKGSHNYAIREPARLPSLLRIPKGQIATWDDRFVIDNRIGSSELIVTKRGSEHPCFMDMDDPARPATVRAGIPVLLIQEGVTAEVNSKLNKSVHFGATIPLTQSPFAS